MDMDHVCFHTITKLAGLAQQKKLNNATLMKTVFAIDIYGVRMSVSR
jgi:hypothetical protein